MTDPRVIQVSTTASYSELREAQEQINSQLALISAQARADALAVIVANIKEFGITADELNAALSDKPKRGRKPGKVSAAVTGEAKATKKAAPKYRDPATGSTWTGRGIAPAWIKDYAKEDRDQFLINDPAPVSVPEATPTEVAPEAPAEDAVTHLDPVAETKPLFVEA